MAISYENCQKLLNPTVVTLCEPYAHWRVQMLLSEGMMDSIYTICLN